MKILQQVYPTSDELFGFLEDQGYEGSLNDKIWQYLYDQGYRGDLADMLLASNYFPTLPANGSFSTAFSTAFDKP